MSKEMYLGFTGLPGAGKSESIHLLKEFVIHQGIVVYTQSLSDEVTEELRMRGMQITQITRENKVLIGNQLRSDYGGGILARRVITKITDQRLSLRSTAAALWLIDAIRNPSEVEEFRNHFGWQFVLMAIEAPINVIVHRLRNRNRSDESQGVIQDSRKAKELLVKESGSGHISEINVQMCIQMADFRFSNDDSLKRHKKNLQTFFQRSLSPLLQA